MLNIAYDNLTYRRLFIKVKYRDRFSTCLSDCRRILLKGDYFRLLSSSNISIRSRRVKSSRSGTPGTGRNSLKYLSSNIRKSNGTARAGNLTSSRSRSNWVRFSLRRCHTGRARGAANRQAKFREFGTTFHLLAKA